MSALVCIFNVSPLDAWKMTVREYWMLHRFKFPDEKPARNAPVSKKEMDELILKLRQKGKGV